ncbi:hypothetical protein EDB82DRAFT_496279 [Fusarium venenatum]|uniref:uncharacterized protein n=1 Tax=Fusarium venenatum TaxID=56646 RepID=UPI001DED9750|nr:hypothetical protein EDB82DRAFT_496279 [Fusarium venenatum]
MATRNVTGSHVRQSMVASGGAVKARQLVSSSKPCFELSCLLLYPQAIPHSNFTVSIRATKPLF